MTKVLLLCAALVAAGCGATLRPHAWRYNRETCLQSHQNGVWEVDRCRAGSGVLVWAQWTL